jgi:hypothetical protein
MAIQVLAHIPRLRMTPDRFETPGGSLVKLTWESYDGLTLGAFSGSKHLYEATDPVFLLVELNLDLPFVRPGPPKRNGMVEMKVPRREWADLLPRITGSAFLPAFHEQLVDTVWAGLTLATPGAAPADPRMSVTILLPAPDTHVQLGTESMQGIRVQGEADQEYVFGPATACRPLEAADLQRACEFMPAARNMAAHPELGPALRQLLGTSEASLASGDRLLLAVSALEALLLPEVATGQQDALAARVTALLGDAAEPIARALYRARSRAVHDGPDMAGDVIDGTAEQLLADVLIAAEALIGGDSDKLLPSMSPELPAAPATLKWTETVRGSAGSERLHPRPPWASGTGTAGVDLQPVGLENSGSVADLRV